MSLAILTSRALEGMSAPEVMVEVHLANGLPSVSLVGLPDTEVKEARDRVRAALVTSIRRGLSTDRAFSSRTGETETPSKFRELM